MSDSSLLYQSTGTVGHNGHQECTLVYNMSMSALVQVAVINGALVQVAAIISALVQLGCYH